MILLYFGSGFYQNASSSFNCLQAKQENENYLDKYEGAFIHTHPYS